MKSLTIVLALLILASYLAEAALTKSYLERKLNKWVSSSANNTKPNIVGPGGMQVNSFTGNLFLQRRDVLIPSRGIPVEVTFSYNSGLTKNDWGFGKGWTSNFNMMYQRTPGFVTVRCEDGRKDKFTESSGSYTPPPGVFNTLSEYTPGRFLLQTKDGMQYFFDDSTHKKLTKIQDPNGNTITMSSFSVLAQPSLITDANGRSIRMGWSGAHLAYILDSITSPPRTTSYHYDARGNLKSVTDPMSNVYQYQYDARSRLVGFTDELLHTVAVAFNDSGAVSSITTPGSSDTPPTSLSIVYAPPSHQTVASELVAGAIQSTTYTFDGLNRIIRIQGNCCGYDEQYQYDAQNNITRTVNSNGNGTNYTYDSKGNQLSETNALSHTASWTYEPTFNGVTSVTDKRGNTTSFSYDSHGNLLTVSKPLGITESFTYDAFGNVVSATDGRGNITTCSYDANGNLVGVSHPIGSESFSYDNSGNPTSWTDAAGRTTTCIYDALDRRVSMTNALGGSRLYLYGGASNLVQEIDENGHSTSYAYDALDRLIAVTKPEGTIAVTRDAYGNIRQSVDFNGNLASYAYDGRNRVASIIDPLGHSRSLAYDNNDNLLSETDFNGNTTTYLYDALDRRTRTTNPLGHDVLLVYDLNDNVVSRTDPNGHVTTYAYDALDRRVQVVHPIGNESFTYDNNDNLTSGTDPNGHTMFYSYDANDRLISRLDPLLHTTALTYDPAGNVVSVTNPNGLTSTYSYDALHRMVSATNPLLESTTSTYDAVGNRVACVLPYGNALSYAYDASDRMTSVSDALGLVASYTYDANSNVLTESDGNGNTTLHMYDPLDRLTSVIAPLGQSTVYAYDNNSNLVSTTDGAGGTTTYTYDGLSRQITTTFPGGLTTTCSYDAAGNPSSVLDGRGNTTSFTRDAMDRLTQILYANGSNRQCTYDPAGNVLSLQDQNANTITYAYDAMDRRTARNFPDGTSDVFTYDNAGRMITASNLAATISFTYDGADRVLTEVLNGKTTSRSYNVVGRTMTMTYPGGRVVTEEMNPRLLTSSRRSGALTLADYTYDAASRRVSQTNANGSSTLHSYNNNGWATGVSHTRSGALMAGFNYTFDNRGFRSTVEKLHRPDNSEKYQYDATTRLTGYREGLLVGGNIPVPITQTQFTFDAIGNRTNSTKDAVPTTYVANTINAYTSITGGISLTPSYDANGNMTSDGARAFTYDYMDRLTSVLDVATNAAYTYDALGRRIQKVVNGITDRYLFGLREYDPVKQYLAGDAVIEERDGSDAVTSTFVVGNDAPVVMTRHGSVTQNYYYHQNSLGSVVAITDDSGRVAERNEYDSFGKVSIYDSAYVSRATSAIGNIYLFGGMEYDAETGLYYDHARHYHPQLGRFMQQDPTSVMGDEPDLRNGYSYVGNNPTNFIDPSGEMKTGKVKFFNEAKGFGFVATVAVPQYSKFQAKARQSELRVSGNGSFSYGRGPRQSTSLDGSYARLGSSQNSQTLRKGWDGTIKGIAYVTGSAIDELNIDDWGNASKKDFKGHVTLLKRGGDESGSARHTKTGHVTLLKRNDDGSASGRHTKTGHVTLMKAYDDGSESARYTKTGHVTLMKAYDDGDAEYFQTGDKPTQSQFSNLIDSYIHRLDDGLTEAGIGKSMSNIQNNRVISLNGLSPGVPWEVPLANQVKRSKSNVGNNRVIPLWGLPPGVPLEAAYSSGKKDFKGHVTLLK